MRSLVKLFFFEKVLKGLGLVAEKTGLKASIRSQCQRLACLLVNDKVSKDEIKPGTPLLVDLFGVLEHSGIYLGNGKVAELYGDDLLREVSLNEFVNGDSKWWLRTGKAIYAACSIEGGLPLSSRNAVWNAQQYIKGIRTIDYNLLSNNCHLFSISCLSGEFQGPRTFYETISKGGISIGVLTSAISHLLNGNDIVVWKPVIGWNKNMLESTNNNPSNDEQFVKIEDTGNKLLVSYIKKIEKENEEIELQDEKEVDDKIQTAHDSVFEPCIPFVKAAYRTVRDSIKERTLNIPHRLIVMTIAGIAYFISPIDAIPDIIPVVGFGDDAGVLLLVLRKIIKYLKIPKEDIVKIMQLPPNIDQWIKNLSGGKKTNERGVYTDFRISKKLLFYYIKRFGLQNPFELNDGVKNTYSLERSVEMHGWQIRKVSSFIGADSYCIKDPYDVTVVKDDKRTIEQIYEYFIWWYDHILIPAILNEDLHGNGLLTDQTAKSTMKGA